jgi:hypothetical protein
MNDSVRTSFWVILYAFLAGISLALFANIGDFIKYVFSLLAIYIGIRFFRRFETIGLRVTFIVLAIVFYFLAAICFAMYAYIKENPVPA